MSLACVEKIPELSYHVLSYCDYRELGALQGASKQWYGFAGEEKLWKELFKQYFQEEMPQIIRCKETFRNRLTPVRVDNQSKLHDFVASFLCHLNWDSKRQLICSFPNEPSYSLNIQQGFGPNRGTKEGFEGMCDEVQYLQYHGTISPGTPANETIPEENFTQCPGGRQTLDGFIPSKEKGIPFCIRVNCVSARYPSYGTPMDGRLYIQMPTATKYLNGYIEGVDVGYGNTLGYFSSINEWKTPFKLHCTTGKTGQPIWVGLFPMFRPFKFVLINPQGGMRWEQANGDRRVEPWDTSGYGALQLSLTRAPIRF